MRSRLKWTFQFLTRPQKIDETPVHNIEMERQCGKVDYRLKKYLKLPAVSRSIILQRSKQLREGELPSFRGFKEAAKAKLDKEYGWLESEKQKGLYIILKLNRKLIKSFLKLIVFYHSSIIPLAKERHECLSKFKSSFHLSFPIWLCFHDFEYRINTR